MQQTVYMDLLFFVNFCMDFQCLFLTAKLLRRPFFVWRGVLFSAVGALYACVALFAMTARGVALVLDLVICALMCIGVFTGKGQPIHRFFVPFAIYFGVSAAVGGVMSAMASLMSKMDIPYVESGTSVSSGTFFLLAAAGGVATFAWARFCQRRAQSARAVLKLELTGQELTVPGLFDTAHLLSDPVSGRPVVVLKQCVAAKWLPSVFPAEGTQGTAALLSLPPALLRRARLIPTDTVTGHSLLLALVPDTALLDTGGGARSVELLVSAAPIVSTPSDCQALLPAALLTE